MNDLEYAIAKISETAPEHSRQLGSFAAAADEDYRLRAGEFLGRFRRFMESTGRTYDHGIACYLKMRECMVGERLDFLRSGHYSNRSFHAVARSVYHNPEVMEYHMYGLAFAQFLWPEQVHRFSFFCENFSRYAPEVKHYLEIGGGHGLYGTEALRVLPESATIDLVDISASSIELAKGTMGEQRVGWHLTDIFEFEPGRRYDFITMGEVLEHLEDPLRMLRRIQALLAPGGTAYITTPANAPMVDHIYLFRNAGEIRAMLAEAGFAIEKETSMYAESMPVKRAELLRVPMMYAAFVRPG